MSMFRKEGDQIIVRETGEPARLFFVENFGFSHFPNGEMLKFIDAVVNNGANGIRVFGFFPMGKGREEEPYPRPGGHFDLNSGLNGAYVNYLHQWMDRAQKRGVVILYELFDSVGLKYSSIAEYHPFGQFTQGRLHKFSELSNHVLVAHQENYLTHIVTILKQYPNVIFAIMNEFDGDEEWHERMSHHVKALAPDHLIAGSAEKSEAKGDPSVDIWFSHCASYNKNDCRSNLAHDLAEMRPHVEGKIVGYSTDGFGSQGIKCEEPGPMGDLAQDAREQGLQLFSFLDHLPYIGLDDTGREYPLGTWRHQVHVYERSVANLAHTETYEAIAKVYQPVPASRPEPPIEGVVGKYRVIGNHHIQTSTPLFSDFVQDDLHEGARVTVSPTISGGFLSYGPYVTGYPAKPLDVYFGIFIDNNTDDDLPILVLDVYDAPQQRLLAQDVITRRQFSRAGEFSLFKLSFTPTAQSMLEFRIYFYGYAQVTVKANYIAVIEPETLQLHTYQDLKDIFNGPDQNIIIRESLKDGKSEKGSVNHGDFTAEGLQMRGNDWYLKYEIPTTPRGFVEFSARGFIENEGKAEGIDEYKGLLVTMWDERPGHSPFAFQLRRYGYIKDRDDATDAFKFKIETPSLVEAKDSGYYQVPWDPNTTYRFRWEWTDRSTQLFRDGQEVAIWEHPGGEFTPSNHRVQIGANSLFRKKASHDLLISDVVVGKL